jgi:hypothetical protein
MSDVQINSEPALSGRSGKDASELLAANDAPLGFGLVFHDQGDTQGRRKIAIDCAQSAEVAEPNIADLPCFLEFLPAALFRN